MSEIKIAKMNELPVFHKNEHPAYEFYRHKFIGRDESEQCQVGVYEILPQKAAYPYHFHHQNEEVFYIISGEGLLKTPDGDKKVEAGDLLFFPANHNGAHKLINTSESANLIYLDFDTIHLVDVAEYPDSKKIGIYGKDINKVFKQNKATDYYDGE